MIIDGNLNYKSKNLLFVEIILFYKSNWRFRTTFLGQLLDKSSPIGF